MQFMFLFLGALVSFNAFAEGGMPDDPIQREIEAGKSPYRVLEEAYGRGTTVALEAAFQECTDAKGTHLRSQRRELRWVKEGETADDLADRLKHWPYYHYCLFTKSIQTAPAKPGVGPLFPGVPAKVEQFTGLFTLNGLDGGGVFSPSDEDVLVNLIDVVQTPDELVLKLKPENFDLSTKISVRKLGVLRIFKFENIARGDPEVKFGYSWLNQ